MKNKKISILVVGFMLLLSVIGLTPKTSSAAANFIWPAEGVVTDYVGTRGGSHHGIDIAKSGTVPIKASAAGTVSRSYYSSSYGEVVFIKHNINGVQYETVYAHMRSGSRTVSEGQTVKQGAIIGYMGSTGDSTGQHLHFELHKGSWNVSKSDAVNPLPYLGQENNIVSAASTIQDREYDGTFATLKINATGYKNVNVFGHPGYGLKGTLPNGGSYKVYDKAIDSNGNTYYDLGDNTWILSKQAKLTQYIAIVSHTTMVNVYNAPNGTYKNRVSAGSTFKVYAAKDGWYDIGQNTWIKSEYVKIK